MALGGDDLWHDLLPKEKNVLEKELREAARLLRSQGRQKDSIRKLTQANEISRRKSKRAHRGRD